MIILDTNVLSALTRPDSDPAVSGWLDRHAFNTIWITSVTLFEIEFGIELMASGRRQQAIRLATSLMIREKLENRILPFDDAAAAIAATLAAKRQHTGRQMEIRDTMIAGIVLSRQATLATRNGRHFEGVPVVNPWADQD